MKKLIMVVLAAVLSFGSAVPAFAVGPHHKAGQCLDYSEVCHRMAQSVIAPGLQSLNERLSAVLDMCALPLDPNAQGAGQQVDTYATSPSLCANGACEMYLDADHDGICDYHGANCPNMSGSANSNNGSAGSSSGNANSGSGSNGGSYHGGHHNSGHHGGNHHYE